MKAQAYNTLLKPTHIQQFKKKEKERKREGKREREKEKERKREKREREKERKREKERNIILHICNVPGQIKRYINESLGI